MQRTENTLKAPFDSCTALSELLPGETGLLHHMELTGFTRLRLMDLGFTPGVLLEMVRKGPRGKLMAVRVRGTVMAIRHTDAAKMFIVPSLTGLPPYQEGPQGGESRHRDNGANIVR
ncbi:MAG: FeoA family protein [Bacillota bacterium]|nr:ferrous iron transport protein A [Candidatus Fermentithermobacillaceae bacterium]